MYVWLDHGVWPNWPLGAAPDHPKRPRCNRNRVELACFLFLSAWSSAISQGWERIVYTWYVYDTSPRTGIILVVVHPPIPWRSQWHRRSMHHDQTHTISPPLIYITLYLLYFIKKLKNHLFLYVYNSVFILIVQPIWIAYAILVNMWPLSIK